MKNNHPTVVIFDIGKVLIHWDPRNLYEKLITDKEELDWFLTEVVSFDWHHEHDRGVPFAASLAGKAIEFPDYSDLIYAYRERWRETIPGEVEGTVDILQALCDRDVPCYALTNFSAETFPELEAEFGWVKWFRDIVVSGRECLVKPELPIFHLAKARFGVLDGEALFIDDRADNIKSGEAVGFIGHQFVDAETLIADLKVKGLL